MVTQMAEELLTVEEVAARLKLTPYTIREWLKAGRLHGVRIGSRRAGWRIPASELDRYMSAQAIAERPDA
jgi:excisionase family DNA binding protein